MKGLNGQLIVITGASSGAGRAIANEFAKYGSTLVLAARRVGALKEVADECTSLGATVHIMKADTRNALEVRDLARFASELRGSIDVWVNNAGVLAAGAMDDVPPEVNENVIRTNLIGYINGAQQVLPYFKSQGYGVLINNISVGGWFPTPYAAAYTASKFGIRGFSEALKGELSKFPNISVVDLYPAFLDTPGVQHAANYTGKVIKPAPPVSDARLLARAVVASALQPTSRKSVGLSSALLRLSYATFPKLSRNITAMVIRKYLDQADEIENTPGNILEPVDFGTSIDGGWSRKLRPSKSTLALAGLALAGVIFLANKVK